VNNKRYYEEKLKAMLSLPSWTKLAQDLVGSFPYSLLPIYFSMAKVENNLYQPTTDMIQFDSILLVARVI
jgi:hypothetical protein